MRYVQEYQKEADGKQTSGEGLVLEEIRHDEEQFCGIDQDN